jgi:L,D-transpeptidase ErfK/SrfK
VPPALNDNLRVRLVRVLRPRSIVRGYRSILIASAIAAWIVTAGAATSFQSGNLTGERWVHIVERGESLASLGARVGRDPRVIASMNGLRRDARLLVGQPLLLDSRHVVPAFDDEVLIINIPQRMLFLRRQDGSIAGFPVAVGRPDWPTFTGPFEVELLETNPVWEVPVSIQQELRRAGKPVVTRVAPGPNNPLGAYWIGLSIPGFGIHSTNAPASIYQLTTHGCIRLHPDDAKQVFSAVDVGTCGRIIYEPLSLTWLPDGQLLLEAHPDAYRRQPDATAVLRSLAARLGAEAAIDWSAAAAVLERREGVPTGIVAPAAGFE